MPSGAAVMHHLGPALLLGLAQGAPCAAQPACARGWLASRRQPRQRQLPENIHGRSP